MKAIRTAVAVKIPAPDLGCAHMHDNAVDTPTCDVVDHQHCWLVIHLVLHCGQVLHNLNNAHHLVRADHLHGHSTHAHAQKLSCFMYVFGVWREGGCTSGVGWRVITHRIVGANQHTLKVFKVCVYGTWG